MKKMENNISKKLFSEKETSHYIGMSRSFLRQARVNGTLQGRTKAPKFIKIGRTVRYLKSDLDAWIESFKKLEHLGQMEESINKYGRT